MNGLGTQPHILCNLVPNFHRITEYDEPERIKLHLQKLNSIQVPSTEEQDNKFTNFPLKLVCPSDKVRAHFPKWHIIYIFCISSFHIKNIRLYLRKQNLIYLPSLMFLIVHQGYSHFLQLQPNHCAISCYHPLTPSPLPKNKLERTIHVSTPQHLKINYCTK